MSWLRQQLVFLPTLAWNVLLGRILKLRHWWDRVDEHVVLGALPFARDVPRLAEIGVRGVVNTCAEYAGPQEAYRRAGIEQLRLPIRDFTHPTLEHVDQGLDLMRRCADQGESVYVHCKAGRARSATIVMCWLIEQYGMTPEEAQQKLLEARPHVNRHLAERQAVREFFSRHLDRQRGGGASQPAQLSPLRAIRCSEPPAQPLKSGQLFFMSNGCR